MKKMLNTIFFGSCFTAAVILEAFCIQVLDGNLFSAAGLGIVVLITGYLFMDSIRSAVKKGGENAKAYMDHLFYEELEKWNERYTELVNLQKASYTAIKKNTARIAQQFEEVLAKLEAQDNNNAKALLKITELQKKALEGQKNALNLEIGYNRENTKKILGFLKSYEKDNDISGQLARIISLLEKNGELLKIPDKAFYKEEEQEYENAPETDMSEEDEPETEADTNQVDADNAIKVTPLYADPNKNLTAEEIAALFASIGK